MTRDRSFYDPFIKLTLALMLQQAVALSVNLADNIMLGSYSETALSGVAAVNQIQFVLQQVIYGISNGMVVLASQYWGQKKTEPVRKLMSVAFWVSVGIAAALFVGVSLFPRTAVGMFSEDAAIVEQGISYLSIIRSTYLFFAATTIFLGGMRAVEKVKIALYVSVAALAINCSINFVLIKGRLGFPEMGARGAAVGTLTARIVECLIVGIYVLHKDGILHLRIKDLLKIDRALASDYFRISLPVVVTGFLWGCNSALQTAILGHMSSGAIAAHSISSTIFLFLKVTPVGGLGGGSLDGEDGGDRKPAQNKRVYKDIPSVVYRYRDRAGADLVCHPHTVSGAVCPFTGDRGPCQYVYPDRSDGAPVHALPDVHEYRSHLRRGRHPLCDGHGYIRDLGSCDPAVAGLCILLERTASCGAVDAEP